MSEAQDSQSVIVNDETAQHLEYNQDWNGLAAHLAERLASEPEHIDVLAPYLIEVFEENLDAIGQAIVVVSHWLEKSPRCEDALAEAERLFTSAGQEDWAGLVKAYRTVIAGIDDGAIHIALLEKLAEIQFSILKDAAGSYETALNLLALAPKHVRAWEIVDAYHTDAKSWRTYVGDLAAVAHQRTADAGPLMVRMAYILDNHLDQPEVAIGLYQRAVTLGGDPHEALAALAELHAEDEAWDRAVGVYTTLLSHTTDRGARTELLRKIAIVHDALDAPKNAEIAYGALQALVPDDEEAKEALSRLRGE